MQFRYARHTNNLAQLIRFYTEIIGLEELGGFKDHHNYNGVFLGPKKAEWHLEFTSSPEIATHSFDEDDLLVFYLNTEAEVKSIVKNAGRNNLAKVSPKNPYWATNSHTFFDPDGYRVVISLRPPLLYSTDDLTKGFTAIGIPNWNDAVQFIRKLPYGRTSSRSDFSLVIKERKGTCSAKHALLKQLADLNVIAGVSLVLGMYKMTGKNTPGIGHELTLRGLDCIPEAHCYLKLNGYRFDFTNPNADIEKIENDILTELEITPEQVIDFKVNYHKDFLRNWIKETGLKIDFEELWEIRERCITNLTG